MCQRKRRALTTRLLNKTILIFNIGKTQRVQGWAKVEVKVQCIYPTVTEL